MRRVPILIFLVAVGLILCNRCTTSARTVTVNPVSGDATQALRDAIEQVRGLAGEGTVTISLQPGAVYDLSRDSATALRYYVSNTTSVDENPDPVKHVGILLKGMENVVIDGRGATLRTHGEMTPWVIDGCRNIVVCNLTVDAADPTVTEMTVIKVDSASFVARVHPSSDYMIRDGKLYWQGEGWEFTDGIAQIYDPLSHTTHRCPSPVVKATAVSEISPGLIRFELRTPPDVAVGHIYQMRHSLRTEVAGLIIRSENVELRDLNLHFMGNFGIVAQTSTDLAYHRLNCEPDSLSDRSCAGFADFLQVSGCRGLVDIRECRFSGSHDDPINVHGTHLKIVDWEGTSGLVVRYMHPQTYGFQSFFAGDTIEIVDSSTLRPVAIAKVAAAEMIDDYNIRLILNHEIPDSVRMRSDMVVENTTWTPAVNIIGCRFSATPTRGILVTTRRPVVIAENVFYRIPMAAILIADDARSWFESGPVKDVTIRDNRFIDCSLPVIKIAPEISRDAGPVHSNISIIGNQFEFTSPVTEPIISTRATDRVNISDNKEIVLSSDSL